MSWAWLIQSDEAGSFCSTPLLFPLVKVSKKGFPCACEIWSWTRIGWPMEIWLLIVFYWTTNQKSFWSRYWSIKKDVKTGHQGEQEKGPENNSRLPNLWILDPRRSEQPSGCRNSKSQTFKDIGSCGPHLVVTFLSQCSSSVCQEGKPCCFIVSQKCFNKTIFVKFLATGFSGNYLSCWTI